MSHDEPRSLRAVAGPAGSVGERLTDAAIRHRVSTGKLVRLARGAYVDPRLEWSPQRDLLAVALASPDVVFSHFTALQLLGASGLSADIWVSIGHKDRPPSAGDVPIQIVRCLPGALVEGVGAQRVENLDIRVTTAARTVVDFFKSRNKLGLDVAVHALIAVRRSALASVDDIWLEAQRHKMCGEIGPYLRAVGGQA